MGDIDTLGQLQEAMPGGLEIFLTEELETISQKAGQNATYYLQYASNRADSPEKMFIYLVPPHKMGKAALIHQEYNLTLFTDTVLRAQLPVPEQLNLMNAALDEIAKIDPRIKGEQASPERCISRIGGRTYDLELMQRMYQYVQKELRERQR